ncbi:glycosyltransferase family 2 protein [bacterium]|nr:glycosyltransferase family 2 protein [bacterium]
MKRKLSVIVPTFNEEHNIRDCLESVKWADEIFVVDSFSKDKTLEIASEYTNRIIKHEYVNSANQKNWAIPQATFEWVMIVDSDERVTQDLKEEILSILSSDNPSDGYYIPRVNTFLGKEIKHCGWGKTGDYNLRLFKRDKGIYEDKHVHADVILDGKAGYIKSPLIHNSYPNLTTYIEKLNRYTDWAANDLCQKGRKIGLSHILLRPVGTFFKMFLLELGFLDGYHGFLLSMLSSFYVFIKYSKARQLQNQYQAKKG